MSNNSISKSRDELVVNRIGIQCFVVKEGQILLGKRKYTFGEDTWGLPGGHLEKGESILAAASRELFEETGLACLESEIVGISDAIPENNYHLQIGILINRWTGTPEVREPSKCSEFTFFPINELPSPLFISSVTLIENFKKKKLY